MRFVEQQTQRMEALWCQDEGRPDSNTTQHNTGSGLWCSLSLSQVEDPLQIRLTLHSFSYIVNKIYVHYKHRDYPSTLNNIWISFMVNSKMIIYWAIVSFSGRNVLKNNVTLDEHEEKVKLYEIDKVF